MDVSQQTLEILVTLLPGFVTAGVLNAVVVQKPKDHVGRLIEALVFSFVIYSFVIGVLRISPTTPAPGREMINRSFLLSAIGASLTLPLILGFLIRNDLHTRALRTLRITDKSSRETVWVDVFTNEKRYVTVNLSGGRRVFGWPMYYSDTQEEGTLYIQDPAWVNDDGTYTELAIHGLFLIEKDAIESIEFTHVTKKNAQQRGQEQKNG
jgi:hypothetical protein